METALAIHGIVLLLLGIYLCLRPHVPSALASYAGIWILEYSGKLDFPTVMLSYWGIMVAFVITVSLMQPQALVKATQGMAHTTTASLAGMFLGLTLGYSEMIIGAALGAVAGMFLFSRTPKGAALDIRTARFWQYLCAKGFPIVISVALSGIALMVALKEYRTLPV